MDKSLFRYIWKYSRSRQIVILFITVLSFPILYYTLELPKMIVNDAIQGTDFPREIFGAEFGQVEFLILLCFGFLALVILNNGVKYTLNIYKGITGERMLRRLRYDLYERVLRFRLPHFRNISSGEIIPMITAEVEPLGGFIGDAIALPAFQGGTLLVYISFIFVQDPYLGAAAIALYPVQAVLIPRLQAKVIRLARERVKNIRQMSDRIGESITAVGEIHGNDTSVWHLADISDRLLTNFQIRLEIFKRKYMIKFVNNFLNQLTPFFFYSVGGYLVIEGEISFGALVAVLAAYKDLAGPWKELLSYYQQFADVQVKYQTVIENFDPPDLYPRERLLDDAEGAEPLSGEIVLKNVSFSGGTGQELSGISFTIPSSGAVAVVGGDGSGRSELLQIMAGLISADSGKVTVGGRDVDDLPEAVLGRSIAHVPGAPHIFTDTIRGNLRYGLRHRPQASDDPVRPSDEVHLRQVEAEATANTPLDILDRWENFAEAGVADADELDGEGIGLIDVFGMGDDVYRMGLQSRVDVVGGLAERVLSVRKAINERVTSDPELDDLIDLWAMDRYNRSATLVENLLFALPADPNMELEHIPDHPAVTRFLQETEMEAELVEIGLIISETMIELFSTITDDNSLLGEFSFITVDELPTFEKIVRKAKADAGKLNYTEKRMLIGVAFKLIPTRHRLGIMNEERERKVLAARARFRDFATDEFVLFDIDHYIPPLTIEDNLIFGKPRLDRRGARERIDMLIGDTVAEMDLRTPIALAGLDFHVGVAGSRLSAGQRQKVGLARALLKRPAITILNGIADTTSEEDQHILNVIKERTKDRILVFGASRLELVKDFEQIFVIKDGKLAAQGTYAEVSGGK